MKVQHGRWGTAPLQVVQYARQLFEKGDLVKRIRHRLAEATQRAQGLSMAHTPYSDPEPFTDLHTLVSLLTSLRD